MTETINGRAIAKNTLMLYFRQILIMLISLYSVRVVLEVLGVIDYGIYSVVAGIVTMFSFLSGAMATASQRYFSFELGKKNFDQLKKTFSISIISYFFLCAIIVIISETVGLWFVSTKLVIPSERLFAAKVIYQTSIISLIFTMLTTPYMAIIIAHEDMSIYAYVSILEVSLKLAILFLLKKLPGDPLILYGILFTTVVFLVTTVYRTICRSKYKECKSEFYFEKNKFFELLSYTSWNVFGAAVGVLKVQGVNILLNQFFNPVIIASRSIASQVNTAISSFAHNFSTAVRPQIIKAYAAKNYLTMNKLIYTSCKSTFSLMYLFAFPLILQIQYVLEIWLKNPPDYAVEFTRLALVDALFDAVSFPLMTAAQATGKIKIYQSIVGGILLLNLPIAYIILRLGYSPSSVFVISIALTITAFIVRLLILKRLIIFSVTSFVKIVILPIFTLLVTTLPLPIYVTLMGRSGLLNFLIVVPLTIFLVSFASYFILLDKNEKNKIKKYIMK